MVRESFLKMHLRPDTRALIAHSNEVIQRYNALGLTLTLRQLYYQLVQQNIIRNDGDMYDKLGDAVANARLCGLMDWDAIEDRIRVPWKMPEFDDAEELVQAALNTHRRDRWDGQPHYVEAWIEKDAISGVVLPITQEYHITLVINRGYSSISALYEARQRFNRARARHQRPVLLYFGDHDPSGLDMDRDIQDRLATFGVKVDFRRLGLTTEQVRKYNPPPNPAKFSDSRAENYVREHGNSSWEVDALPPEVIQDLLRKELDSLLDKTLLRSVLRKEKADKALIRRKFGLSDDEEE